MNQATINNRQFQVPGCLNELSTWQLVRLAELVHTQQRPAEMAIKAILVLLEVKKKAYLWYLFLFHVTAEHLQELLPLTNFLFKSDRLTKNLLPVIRIPWRFKKLYGPADGLANISFLEYIKAEHAFIAFHRTKKELYLNRLVAILYRPHRSGKFTADTETGDIREKYNDATTDQRLKLVASLPMAKRLAILLYFAGSRQAIIELYPEVFPEKVTTSATAKQLGWAGVLRNLAGHLSQYEATGAQNIHTVLFDLKAGILESQEREAKLKSEK